MNSDAARAGGVLTVDLRALQENYRAIQRQVAPAECGASVKANAYGIGMAPAARALWAAGCRSFFVALPEEGERLRVILPEAIIYVLGGLFPGQARFYAEQSLRPVLGQMAEIEEWAKWCAAQGKALPAGLHIETGINRLGLRPKEIEEISQRGELLSRLELTLVLSHLAKADEPEDSFNRHQLQSFERLRGMLRRAPASLANSPGSFLPRAFHFDLVRPGVALYGGNPFAERPNPFRPVAFAEARVLQVTAVEAGESVGYGGSWRAPRHSCIAIVSAGYADGYPRACSSKFEKAVAAVWARGYLAPVVGRVSMDMITVDVTDMQPRIGRGEMVELMGEHVTVDDLARWAGTIPYEILTRLGPRYLRRYSSFDS